jgi:hypothetical protein
MLKCSFYRYFVTTSSLTFPSILGRERNGGECKALHPPSIQDILKTRAPECECVCRGRGGEGKGKGGDWVFLVTRIS